MAEDHSRPLARRDQRGREAARVDLVVAVHPQTAADTGSEHRLQAPALTAGQPFRGESGTPLQGVQFPQMGAVVGVERDGERPAGAVADALPARLLQLGDERRIALCGGDVEREQRLLAVVQFGDGGEHARGDLRRAAARLRIGDGDGQPALGRAPGRDQSDDSAPDDENV